MDDKLVESINDLKLSVENLTESINSLTTIQTDIFNSNNHDMMQTLNGSLQELIKTMESRS